MEETEIDVYIKLRNEPKASRDHRERSAVFFRSMAISGRLLS
jgi:hypothetical protein